MTPTIKKINSYEKFIKYVNPIHANQNVMAAGWKIFKRHGLYQLPRHLQKSPSPDDTQAPI